MADRAELFETTPLRINLAEREVREDGWEWIEMPMQTGFYFL